MFHRFIQPIHPLLVHIAVAPGDDRETAAKKIALAGLTVYSIAFCTAFALLFLALGDLLGTSYMSGLVVIVLVVTALFARFKASLVWWVNIGGFLMLGGLVGITLFRGSFEQSAYILPLWGLLPPVLMLVMLNLRYALVWFGIYLGLVVLVTVL